jgi:hypothetical protein
MSSVSRTEIQIPRSLSDDLVRKLALLHDAPPGIAESTIALLGFGTRALLAEIDPPLVEMSEDRPVQITITPEGWRVIEACAEWVEWTGADDWTDRAPDEGSWARNHDEAPEEGSRDHDEAPPDEGSWARNHEEKLARVVDVITSTPDAETATTVPAAPVEAPAGVLRG